MIQKVYELAEVEVERQRVFAVGGDILKDFINDFDDLLECFHMTTCKGDFDKCEVCQAYRVRYDSLRKLLDDQP
jgi:hypothetical protein